MTAACRHPNCPELVAKGYCTTHAREIDASYKQRGKRAHYNTKRWRMLARRVLREQPLCACGCEGLATQVDHVVPVEDGGQMWSSSNLQGLTASCHSRKTRDDVARRTFK